MKFSMYVFLSQLQVTLQEMIPLVVQVPQEYYVLTVHLKLLKTVYKWRTTR